jgi:SAM-dependent methyltransferase
VPRLDEHYTNPRLVDLYDIENPLGADTDFYLGLADELDARRIVDLGCGTGLLTRAFAASGREVFGVDPASAMLAFARQQPRAERVHWIEGDATALGSLAADMLVMTGHVAQVFLSDDEWQTTLAAISAALRPGGVLAFESRNPAAHGWEDWNRSDSFAEYDSPHGPMATWVEVTSVEDSRVRFEGHNVFRATGDVLVVRSELRFRTLEELARSLETAGFTVEHVYGDWHKGPLRGDSTEMVFVARRS